jgi:hypothetical protein
MASHSEDRSWGPELVKPGQRLASPVVISLCMDCTFVCGDGWSLRYYCDYLLPNHFGFAELVEGQPQQEVPKIPYQVRVLCQPQDSLVTRAAAPMSPEAMILDIVLNYSVDECSRFGRFCRYGGEVMTVTAEVLGSQIARSGCSNAIVSRKNVRSGRQSSCLSFTNDDS